MTFFLYQDFKTAIDVDAVLSYDRIFFFIHLFTTFETTFISCQAPDFKDDIPYSFDLFTTINVSLSQSLSLPELKLKSCNSL